MPPPFVYVIKLPLTKISAVKRKIIPSQDIYKKPANTGDAHRQNTAISSSKTAIQALAEYVITASTIVY